MANKPVALRRAFVLLEIGLVGLLGWMVVTSDSVSWLNKGVQARDAKIQKQKKRRLPTEGLPETTSFQIALNGTQICTSFDFESGDQGFVGLPQFGTPIQLWHVSDLCRADLAGHSPTHSFYYGQDATCNYDTGARNASNLESPTISLAGQLPPFTLSFNYLLFVEGGGFDSTFVDISTDNGTTWTQILSKANLINDNQWHNVARDVSAEIGMAASVRLRFRFDTIDDIANSTTGWHIDDVQICSSFNLCIQDDSSKSVLQINTTTGQYLFNNCLGATVGGTGVATTKGSVTTLQDNRPDRRVLVKFEQAVKKATASLQLFNPSRLFTVIDKNTANNTCVCPP